MHKTAGTGRLVVTAAVGAAFVACLALPGCFGMPSKPQVAATVNGEEILESEVTEYIEGFRSQNADYETDEGWAGFLSDNGYTAETIRTYVLDSVFIPKLLIHQECDTYGIALTDSELDSVIEQERLYYEERYGESSWGSVLDSYGYDEDSWRDNEEDRLLEEQLAAEVIGDVSVTASQLQDAANSSAYQYNGKHSYRLSFDTSEDAEAFLEDAGEVEDGLTLKKVKGLAEAVHNAGWSSLESDRGDMSQEYIAALNELDAQECSEAFQDGEEWVVVFCDSVFMVDEDEAEIDISLVPEAILGQIEEDARQEILEGKFSEWMADEQAKASIVYASMPDGLSYDVNVAIDKHGDE